MSKALELAWVINQRWVEWAGQHCDDLADAPTNEEIAQLIEQHCEEKRA